MTISFDSGYWARVWLEETQSSYAFLLDPDRAAYRAFGLQSSRLHSWSPRTLWYYLQAAVQRRERLGQRGDPHQLGGDFIVDRRGIIRLAHASRDPLDRPSIDHILATLHALA